MGRETYKYEKYINNNAETRWASEEEIKAEALELNLLETYYERAGIPLISDGDYAYVDDQDTHSLIWGATGSKKTRLFSLPLTNICIMAGESFIAMDPKGELYDNTAGLAENYGYKVVVLNFRDMEKGDCWNPLSIPYQLFQAGEQDNAIGMLMDFLNVLSNDRTDAEDAFWVSMAHSYILANMLLLMKYAETEEVNLASVGKLTSFKVEQEIRRILPYLDENSVESLNYNVVLNTSEKTKGSIISYAYSLVSLFNTQKNLVDKLGCDTFDIRDFATHKTAVYMIVPDEKTTYHFLASTFVKQVYEIMIEQAQKQTDLKLPIRLNYILDEFCNFPTIPDMPSMITAARSRNIRFFLFVQGQKQLVAKYKNDASTIKGNCDNWIFLNSRELELLNEISELCGVNQEEGGRSKPLISVSQLQRLRKQQGEVLILYHRHYPFISYLPDIDDYITFDFYEPSEMRRNDYNCKIVDLNRIREKLMYTEERRQTQLEKLRQMKDKGAQRKVTDSDYFDDYEEDDYEEEETVSRKNYGTRRRTVISKRKKSLIEKMLDLINVPYEE